MGSPLWQLGQPSASAAPLLLSIAPHPWRFSRPSLLPADSRKTAADTSPLPPGFAAGFGLWLRIFCKRKRLTQQLLASILGGDISSVSRWERGERIAGVNVLAGLAVAFPELDLRWLVLGKNTEIPGTNA